ncbi:Flp family type IVb pilin [Acetobacterium fimetarium]|uniref:Flp family type IVb pilin n=1 Tax=Acetobacterium fimetarium TaxID=52691 RepID=UPI001A9BCF50|nr:Flp family type IVb pilin [Acetobacterium fimetarium]
MIKGILIGICSQEDGQGIVEYVFIIAGIALATIAAIVLLGPTLATFFTEVNTELA